MKTDSQPARDVLDQRNFSRGRLQVHHVDGLLDEETGEYRCEGDRVLELGLAEEMSANPLSKIISGIDLLDWLRELGAAGQELLAPRLASHRLEAIGKTTVLPGSTGIPATVIGCRP